MSQLVGSSMAQSSQPRPRAVRAEADVGRDAYRADPVLVALHGFACHVPSDWDLLVNRGNWTGGHLLFAWRRRPVCNLTWDRRARSPDFGRTLQSLESKIFKDHGALPDGASTLGPGGQLGRYQAPEGRYHVAAFRPEGDLPLSLVLRQLAPASEAALRRLVDSCRVYDEAHSVRIPWAIHGLHIELPPQWRLTGIQEYVGLVRAVWQHHVGSVNKTDQVLVMRRYACASHLLTDGDIGAWIRSRMHKREELCEERVDEDGTWSAILTAPGTTMWRRLRGVIEQRHIHAWVEAGEDRLVIQEWKGSGEPPGCLRRAPSAADCPPAIGQHQEGARR